MLAEKLYRERVFSSPCGCGGDELGQEFGDLVKEVYTTALGGAVVSESLALADLQASEKDIYQWCGCGSQVGAREALMLAEALGKARKLGDNRPTREVAAEVKAAWQQAADEAHAAHEARRAAEDKAAAEFVAHAWAGVDAKGHLYLEYRGAKGEPKMFFPRPSLWRVLRMWWRYRS